MYRCGFFSNDFRGYVRRDKNLKILPKMTIFTKLFTFYSKAIKPNQWQFRSYATIVRRELEVPTFCDVHVDLPCHIEVRPLNIHKYHNCDKLIIQVDERIEPYIEHDVNGNQVKIFNNAKGTNTIFPEGLFCSVKVPVKANLLINSQKNITAGYFNGDKLHLTSTEGSISVDRFQGNSVQLNTTKGDINLREFIQASTISAEILEQGSINTGRLQGLDVKLKTKLGNISVESSYSYESIFEAERGNFDLHNVHKSCKMLLKEGNINLAGFDGTLVATLARGSADIHLSRITKDSEINVLNGDLHLRIADACQDYVLFKIQAKGCDIAENIKSTTNKFNEMVVLTPDVYEDNTAFVNCVNGVVNVESASWQDMIKLKLRK